MSISDQGFVYYLNPWSDQIYLLNVNSGAQSQSIGHFNLNMKTLPSGKKTKFPASRLPELDKPLFCKHFSDFILITPLISSNSSYNYFCITTIENK